MGQVDSTEMAAFGISQKVLLREYELIEKMILLIS